jgi:hypothetical protein
VIFYLSKVEISATVDHIFPYQSKISKKNLKLQLKCNAEELSTSAKAVFLPLFIHETEIESYYRHKFMNNDGYIKIP